MKDSKDNIKFEYLFRDEGNYKIFQNVILPNLEKIDVVDFEQQIKNNLIDGEYFYPLSWKLPLQTFGEDTESSWAEFLCAYYTQEDNTVEFSAVKLIEMISSKTEIFCEDSVLLSTL